MKLDLKKGIDFNHLPKRVGDFIVKREAIVLFFVLTVLLGFYGYLWYEYAYAYRWDEVKKQDYMNTKKAGIVFNKARFEKVLNNVQVREVEYQKNLENQKDIFKLK